MLTDERHNYIRNELAAKGRVLAGELAARFGVSEDTARRDLRELAKAGDCRRVYGGAIAPAPFAEPIVRRLERVSEEKLRLATAAVKLITAGQSLFIDGGSTNICIVGEIPHHIELTVATNSLGVAAALAGHSAVKLVILGGVYDADLGTCIGADTLRAVGQFNADLFFLGSCGIDAARGATTFDASEAEVKRAMVANSSAIVVVATHDKIATAAPFRVAKPEAIQHLVVDINTRDEVLAEFKEHGTFIHRAS